MEENVNRATSWEDVLNNNFNAPAPVEETVEIVESNEEVVDVIDELVNEEVVIPQTTQEVSAAVSDLDPNKQALIDAILDGKEDLVYDYFKQKNTDYNQFSDTDVIKTKIANENPGWDADDIELEIEAFYELNGQYPELVVVDNLLDCTHSDGDEWASMRSLLREFKWWARETGAAFLVLHHTSEAVSGNPAPPRSAIQGKVAQTPALILTVANTTEGFMCVAPVKNRYGPADPSGTNVTWLVYEPARMHLGDMETR